MLLRFFPPFSNRVILIDLIFILIVLFHWGLTPHLQLLGFFSLFLIFAFHARYRLKCGMTSEGYRPTMPDVLLSCIPIGIYILHLYLLQSNRWDPLLMRYIPALLTLFVFIFISVSLCAIAISPFLITGFCWNYYQITRLRSLLKLQGYPDLSDAQLRQINRAAGSYIRHFPPYEHLAVLPGFSLDRPESIASLIHCLPERIRR